MFSFERRHRGINGVEYYQWRNQSTVVRIPVEKFWAGAPLKMGRDYHPSTRDIVVVYR